MIFKWNFQEIRSMMFYKVEQSNYNNIIYRDTFVGKQDI